VRSVSSVNLSLERDSFEIRVATPEDVPALARLHVQTFREAHGGGPSVEIREQQWPGKLQDPNHICFLAVAPGGALVGFINGYPTPEEESYDGHLEKIYVLRSHHRKGIGRRLVSTLARALLAHGVHSMNLFSQAENRSIGFFERLGGRRLVSPEGEFHGGYAWEDIASLVEA
jgi:ribosomal protein S18 acetylase RimI-like enzyme